MANRPRKRETVPDDAPEIGSDAPDEFASTPPPVQKALLVSRETDCLVGQALGWTEIGPLTSNWKDRPNRTEWFGQPPGQSYQMAVPHFSCDLGAAMEALLTVPLWWIEHKDGEEFGFSVQIGRLPGREKIVGTTAYGREGDEALTICRAILNAAGPQDT
jgi:hypothetical protein